MNNERLLISVCGRAGSKGFANKNLKTFCGHPLVYYTLSAAELFAAQLSEYGWATTVGESTTGKGRSQVSYILSDGSALHISHEAYLTSKGVDLAAEGGIEPDIAVDLSDEDKLNLYYGLLKPEDDAQLRAAVEAVS